MTMTTPAGLVGDGITGIPGRVLVGLGVSVTVPVAVMVAVFDGVKVTDGVCVTEAVEVTDAVAVTVRVSVAVGVFEGVSVCEGVAEGPVVGVSVAVAALVRVAVTVPVDAVVAVALLVAVSPTVAVAVTVATAVLVAVGCTGPTVIWPFTSSQAGVPSLRLQPFGMFAVALKVSGVTPLPMPVKVMRKSVPPLEFTGVVQAIVIVARPAWVRLTVGALQVLVTVPSATSVVAWILAMVWSKVKLTATPARPVTAPMLIGTEVVPPTVLMIAFGGRLTRTPGPKPADAADAEAKRKARAPPT
jgi:hypothetical protein